MRMDNLDFLEIRFHFGGAFFYCNGKLEYGGGSSTVSYVEVDKLSLPEIKGHLADHTTTNKVLRFHWLMPGKDFSNGLMLLVDDASCALMYNHTTDGGAVDIYVEDADIEITGIDDAHCLVDDEAEQGCGYHSATIVLRSPEKMRVDKDLRSFMQFYRSPTKSTEAARLDIDTHGLNSDQDEECGEYGETHDETESSDEDFLPHADEDSSAEDEETIELRKFAKEIKRNIRANKIAIHPSKIGEISKDALVPELECLEDEGSPFYDSSDTYSYEENSDGEIESWKSLENRYDSKTTIPIFSLGMAFRDSRQFKKALVKYGLMPLCHHYSWETVQR
ncbi:hypothetical protein BS78_06G047400 [Paspalum vaginatum]|nr:hypothetical protein BS78_06G047400 [Paspalum vaginatum]